MILYERLDLCIVPIIVTLLGMIIDNNDVHPAKAFTPSDYAGLVLKQTLMTVYAYTDTSDTYWNINRCQRCTVREGKNT